MGEIHLVERGGHPDPAPEAVLEVPHREEGGHEDGEAEGDEATLAQFVAWLRQGPPWGRVDGVETWPLPDCGGDGPFAVRR